MMGSLTRTGAASRCILLGLLVASLFAACQLSTGRTFQATLDPESDHPLPVSVSDATGLVVGIEPATMDPGMSTETPALREDQTVRGTAIFTFLGGLCDRDARISFGRSDGSYELRVYIAEKPGLGCPAAGVPRSVRISTSEPLPVASVLLFGN